jgi:predicted PolB exonuclease-like 3'-5' exonuclease
MNSKDQDFIVEEEACSNEKLDQAKYVDSEEDDLNDFKNSNNFNNNSCDYISQKLLQNDLYNNILVSNTSGNFIVFLFV